MKTRLYKLNSRFIVRKPRNIVLQCRTYEELRPESVILTLRKKGPYSELFWSAFSRIWTKYGEIRSEKIWTRIIPNVDTFYAV